MSNVIVNCIVAVVITTVSSGGNVLVIICRLLPDKSFKHLTPLCRSSYFNRIVQFIGQAATIYKNSAVCVQQLACTLASGLHDLFVGLK